MKFRGNGKREQRVSSQLWSDWLLRHGHQPYLRDFAERWTYHMELRLQQGAHVRHIAGETLRQVRREGAGSLDLTKDQIREVILILRSVWHYGNTLFCWGRDHNFLNPDD